MGWKNHEAPQAGEYYWSANFYFSDYSKKTIFDRVYARRKIWKDQAEDYAMLAAGNCFEKKNDAEIYGSKVLKKIRETYKKMLGN